MINTYRYGGQGKMKKDGKEIIVQIPSSVVLYQMGAIIKVNITHPQIVQENFKQQGKSVPTVNINALIDTGASCTVIAPDVADQLGLVHTGFQKVSSVQDEQQQPVYYGFIIFPWGSGIESPIVSCPLKNFDCLIGRDILLHWHFTYNGHDGSVVICD